VCYSRFDNTWRSKLSTRVSCSTTQNGKADNLIETMVFSVLLIELFIIED
jgi:hypothetical protein